MMHAETLAYMLHCLPPAALGGTMIFHNVGDLARDDQRRLLEWLRQAGGRTREEGAVP